MKRFLLATVVAMAYSTLSWGGLLLTDSFPVDGTPPPGWTLVSGTGGQGVVGGQLVITTSGTGSGTGDFSKPLSANTSMGTVFAGYDLVITSAPTDALDNYFAHFAVNNTGGGGFYTRVSLNLQGTDTVLGLAESTTTGSVANVFGTTPLALNTTYRIVQSYDFALGESRVWLNPTAITDPSLVDGTFATNAAGIASFNFRINNTSDGNKLIDNLIVADTFDEVVGPAIPEPGTLGLVSLFGLSLTTWRRGRKV